MRIPAAPPWGLFAVCLFALASAKPVFAAWNPAGEVVPVSYFLRVATACTDESGGLLTFWTANSATPSSSYTAVYAHRRLADGTTAPGWPEAGRPLAYVERASVLFETLVAIEDGAGGAFVLFREIPGSSTFRLLSHRLFHMTAGGALDPAWPDSGLAIGRREYGGPPALVRDGNGGVFVSWLDYVTIRLEYVPELNVFYVVHGLSELRLTHASGSGALSPGWSAEGLLVRGVAPESLFAEFVRPLSAASDGAGGVLLAWADSSGGDDVMRVWRIGADGEAAGGWPREGVAVSSLPVRALAGLVPDGSGGGYAAWTGALPPFGDARLAHFDGSGQVASDWPEGGLDPTNGAGQYHKMGGIAPDGSGGVYAMVQGITPPSPAFVRLVRRDGAAGLPAGWTADGLTFEGGPPFLEQIVTPVPDLAGGVRAVWGMAGQAGLYDVRVSAEGAVRPGWSAAAPRLTPLPPEVGLTRFVADEQGALFVLTRGNFPAPEETRAFEVSTREQALAAVAPQAPARMSLSAGPNPVTGSCSIAFTAPGESIARLEILDAGGRRVRSLATEAAGGLHRATWDGRTDSGIAAPAGLYFVVAREGSVRETRRIALVH